MKLLSQSDIQNFLEEQYQKYCTSAYIETDPIQIPHLYSQKENIEIAGFLAATLAWGNRTAIIKSSKQLLQLFENSPIDFLLNANESELLRFNSFVYRTFNGIDAFYFILALQNIYHNHGGLEAVFTEGYRKDKTIYSALQYFRDVFFELEFPARTQKHIANVTKNSSCKRINMFLRWMVRDDGRGVDFGVWKKISVADLKMPLDLHSGKVARELGLLTRKQNDWKAVVELTEKLKQFDRNDPVKYDFALFGYSAFEGKSL